LSFFLVAICEGRPERRFGDRGSEVDDRNVSDRRRGD